MGTPLLQTRWNPELAQQCTMLSRMVLRNHASDCVINSLAGLDFLDLENAHELSRRKNETTPFGIDSNKIEEYLSNTLNKNIKQYCAYISNFRTREECIEYLINYLKENLEIGNATLFSYVLTNNAGHTVTIYRQDADTILFTDIQQRIQKNLRLLFEGEVKMFVYCLYFINPDDNRMDIDVDLNKLVPENKMELGGKRNKSKTKKNKTKKNKTKKNKTKKNKTKKIKKSKNKKR
jgi:hypothetical protein